MEFTIFESTDPAWLADSAEHLAERRERRYPPAIEAGKVNAAEAARDIAAWQAIAADWRFAAALSGEPGDAISTREKCHALRLAIDRAARAGKANPNDIRYPLEIASCTFMLERYERGPAPAQCAQITLAARKAAQHQSLEAA